MRYMLDSIPIMAHSITLLQDTTGYFSGQAAYTFMSGQEGKCPTNELIDAHQSADPFSEKYTVAINSRSLYTGL